MALLFDGFDELALRVTYDRATEHFETVLQAAAGHAKVVVTSRTQHFLDGRRSGAPWPSEPSSCRAIGSSSSSRSEQPQIRRFLDNLLQKSEAAEVRYRLLDEVKDLLGLSENPRMLELHREDLEPERLREAARKTGEITAARLYELLVERWLEGECARTQVRKESLWAAVRAFARRLWSIRATRWISRACRGSCRASRPKQALSEEEARLVMGARSLLKRDAEAMFSFVHRSGARVARCRRGREGALAHRHGRGARRGRDEPADGEVLRRPRRRQGRGGVGAARVLRRKGGDLGEERPPGRGRAEARPAR